MPLRGSDQAAACVAALHPRRAVRPATAAMLWLCSIAATVAGYEGSVRRTVQQVDLRDCIKKFTAPELLHDTLVILWRSAHHTMHNVQCAAWNRQFLKEPTVPLRRATIHDATFNPHATYAERLHPTAERQRLPVRTAQCALC